LENAIKKASPQQTPADVESFLQNKSNAIFGGVFIAFLAFLGKGSKKTP
jgi:hypothetical protein